MPDEQAIDSVSAALQILLLNLQPLPKTGVAVAAFAIGCAAVGLLVMLMDVAFYILKKGSLLDLRHSMKNTPTFAFAWAIGAAGIGWMSLMLNIFQITVTACVTVGLTWPYLFTKLLERVQSDTEIQQVTQEE